MTLWRILRIVWIILSIGIIHLLFFISPNKRGRLVVTLLQIGGVAFVKLGQSLATRVDIVGETYAHHLQKLQDNMSTFPYHTVQKILEKSLGDTLESLFLHFDTHPIASASIAQVHRATTLNGDTVAVKILRPNITRRFERDIQVFYTCVTILEYIRPRTKRLRLRLVVDEMNQWVHDELDLRIEAKNAIKLAENFIGDDDFTVPHVYTSLSSACVLTTSWVEGVRIDNIEALHTYGLNPKDILEKSARIFFLQVFRDGFFHADMHPGNMLITKDGVLAPVDFGIMGRLSKDTRIYVADVLYYIVTQEYTKASEVHFRAGYIPSTYGLQSFADSLRGISEGVRNHGQWHSVSFGQLLVELFKITEKYNMKTRPELLLLQKTIIVAEGVGRTIAPTENMWELIQPTMTEWMIVNRGIGARIEHIITDSLNPKTNTAI